MATAYTGSRSRGHPFPVIVWLFFLVAIRLRMPATPDMAHRLATVRQRIDAACRRAGRSPDDVVLLPVSKTFDVGRIRQAMAAGETRFGESRMQEIRQKAQELAGEAPRWVLIGHLQTNKAKDAARLVHEVQSLDRLSLAQSLDERLQKEGRSLDVLVQVKTSPEPSKFGLDPDELPGFLSQLAAYDTLRVKGLMTMAVNSSDPAPVRRCFACLREWRDRVRGAGHETVSRLSMGMSGDFELAIEEGSTEVRIGTAVFGVRPPASVPDA